MSRYKPGDRLVVSRRGRIRRAASPGRSLEEPWRRLVSRGYGRAWWKK